MIEGVIFDIDGTILDSMPIWEKACEVFLKSIGVDAESGLSKIMFTMSITEGAKFLKERYLLDMNIDEIIAGINNTIEYFYYHHVKLKEGASQLLKDINQANIKIVAATASDKDNVERVLKRLNVMSYFERIFTCTEIGVGKLEPDIYIKAAEYMGISPDKIWVFEDVLHAIKTAKNAGFKTVGVFDESSKNDSEEIKKNSDIYLEKLYDFNPYLRKLCIEKNQDN